MVAGGAADVGTVVLATIVSAAGGDADVDTDVLATIISVVAILSLLVESTSLVVPFFSLG